MAYEVFKRTRTRIESPALSIAPAGRIGTNAAATRIFESLGVKSVLLLWDASRHKLALKAAGKGDENSYTISSAGHSSGRIRARSFLSHIGWRAPNSETIPASWNEKEKMLEAVLPSEYLTSEATRGSKR